MFGRYEVAVSKLHVTRLVHLCEVLDISPIAMIYQVALYLFGKSQEEAGVRAEAIAAVHELPEDTLTLLLPLLKVLRSQPARPLA